MILILLACQPAPTFAEADEVLTRSCGFSSCHGAGAGDLSLDGEGDHARLVGVASAAAPEQTLVVPGDAESSYLIWKIEGRTGIVGEPMPPPAGGLDEESVALLRDWIDAGALP